MSGGVKKPDLGKRPTTSAIQSPWVSGIGKKRIVGSQTELAPVHWGIGGKYPPNPSKYPPPPKKILLLYRKIQSNSVAKHADQ